MLFDVRPAVAVKLSVLDADGTPTTGRFQFVDAQGHVFPPQAKRLAPDLFFQKHIYRAHGEDVLLPPGELTMFYGRGPEYRWLKRTVTIPAPQPAARPDIAVKLERWVDPAAHGFYSGDHHIHAAGCAHYTSADRWRRSRRHVPAGQGRRAERRQRADVGPGLRSSAAVLLADAGHAERAADADEVRHRGQRLRLGSARPRLPAQPEGTDLSGRRRAARAGRRGRLPVLRWTKAQGAVGGYAHSGSGLQIDPAAATTRLLEQLDANKDGRLDRGEAARGLLPEQFDAIDTDRDGVLNEAGAQGESRSRGRSAAELRDSGAEQRRRAGDLRDRRARRRRFHQRDGHRSRSASGTRGIT